MKVRFEQAGGVTGLLKGCEVDTAALSAEARSALAHLKPEAGTRATGLARDVVQYTVTFDDGGTPRTVAFAAGGVPVELRPLIQELKKQAKPLRPDGGSAK